MIDLRHGDCLDVMRTLDAESIDACVCDPPYGIAFMGRKWDSPDNIAFRTETWAEVLRVLKPGAHLTAFSGTRTYHRMVCAIEDAGFEVRDQIGWAYASGFPKSHDISKAIDKAAGAEREVLSERPEFGIGGNGCLSGHSSWATYKEYGNSVTDAAKQWSGWGTALKPSWDPIVLARKPLSERTIAANVLRHGCGGLNIDACRVACDPGDKGEWPITKRRHEDKTYTLQPVATDDTKGRWPANLCWSVPEDEYLLRSNVTPEQKRELYRWLHENS